MAMTGLTTATRRWMKEWRVNLASGRSGARRHCVRVGARAAAQLRLASLETADLRHQGQWW
jgi:hypothetical protein